MLKKVTPDREAPTIPKATTYQGALWPATKKPRSSEAKPCGPDLLELHQPMPSNKPT
jgi:hypothetical protein